MMASLSSRMRIEESHPKPASLDWSGTLKLGGWAAFLAAAVILVANGAFVTAGQPVEGIEAMLRQIGDNQLSFTVGFGAVTTISFLDIFTVPALFFVLRKVHYT